MNPVRRWVAGVMLAAVAAICCALAPVSATAAEATITTVAGGNGLGYSGDGGPATAAALAFPWGIETVPGGGFLFADQLNHAIRRVAPDGTISTIAGGNGQGYSGDGGPATAAQFWFPRDVSTTPVGGLLIVDGANHAIRRLAPDGTIATVAGGNGPGHSGDGGPAAEAQLVDPLAVAVTSDGGYLIAQNNDAIRRVAPDGTITTVAGGNGLGYSGDGGPATDARLHGPTDVAPTTDGGFLIADQGNNAIRRVGPDGVITTVAGVSSPSMIAPTADGGFLVADTGNHAVRRVAPDGTIATVAGGNGEGYSGDGGPALEAQLRVPCGVAATADGGFLVVDFANHAIRRVTPPDTTPPDTQIDSGPADGSVSNETGAAFTYSGAPVGDTDHFECSLDDGEFEPCPNAGKGYAGLADGEHTFSVRAIDAAGNADGSPASRTWVIDTMAPDTQIDSGPADGSVTADNDPGFTYSGDPAADTDHFECSLDDGEFEPCPNAGKSYAGLADGEHTFSVRAVDAAGNADHSPPSTTWTIDATAPDTTITGGPGGLALGVIRLSNRARFTFASPENGVTFACSLDNGPWEPCESPVAYQKVRAGNHTFRVRAIDGVGNVDAAPATHTWFTLGLLAL